MAMDDKRIDQIINKHNGKASALIKILLEIQSENQFLPKEALDRVSVKLKLPLNQVMHTVTFYKVFSLIPKGRHEIHICNGTSCHVRGSQRVIDTLQYLIGIRSGVTDPNSKFSLETVTCLGCCGSGPAIVVDGKHQFEVTSDKVENLLKNCE